MTTLAAIARETALQRVVEEEEPERLMLITFALWLTAQSMPAATAAYEPDPPESSTLTGRILEASATPAIPVPLFVFAAAIPATWVPWSLSSAEPPLEARAAEAVGAGQHASGQVGVARLHAGVDHCDEGAAERRRVVELKRCDQPATA